MSVPSQYGYTGIFIFLNKTETKQNANKQSL